MLAYMNCQTDIIGLVNSFGVVIQVPKIRKEDLPNFVALMNPSLGWCGTHPLCVDGEEKNVYSNVTKFIQLVVWTCMHPRNESNETQLPFSFWWDANGLKNFFENKIDDSGQSWKAIREPKKAEEMARSDFEVIGNKICVSLQGLLNAILHLNGTEETTQAFKAWDTLLENFPKGGLQNVFSNPSFTSGTLMGEGKGPKVGDLCRKWGYRFDKSKSVDEVEPKEPRRKKAPRNSKADKDVTPADETAKSSVPQDEDWDNEDESDEEGMNKSDKDVTPKEKTAKKPVPQDEDGDNEDKLDEEDMSESDQEEDAGTGPLTFHSLVASVPKSAWNTPDDVVCTRTALRESAQLHVEKALFALALSEAALVSKKVPTKKDLTEHFPLVDGKACRLVLQKLGEPLLLQMEKVFGDSIEASPSTGFGGQLAYMFRNISKKDTEESEDHDKSPLQDHDDKVPQEQHDDEVPQEQQQSHSTADQTDNDSQKDSGISGQKRKAENHPASPQQTIKGKNTDIVLRSQPRRGSATKKKKQSVAKDSVHNTPATEMGNKKKK